MKQGKTLLLPHRTDLNYTAILQRMLAQIHKQVVDPIIGKAPLAALTMQENNDPSVALLDAWAIVIEVLNFYQRQYNNENYLLTATELRSIRELARAIGYELNPGVAASTALAFLISEEFKENQIRILQGNKIQSIPADNDSFPQTFETSSDLMARPEWNQLKPTIAMQSILPNVSGMTNTLRLAGTDTDLKIGDKALLTGEVAAKFIAYSLTVTQVTVNTEKNYTEVNYTVDWVFQLLAETLIINSKVQVGDDYHLTFTSNIVNQYESNTVYFSYSPVLGSGTAEIIAPNTIKITYDIPRGPGDSVMITDFLAQANTTVSTQFLNTIRFFALRKRLANFGHNAPYNPDWDSHTPPITIWEKSDGDPLNTYDIYLEQALSDLIIGQWLLVTTSGFQFLYKIELATEVSVTDYGLTGRITALILSNYDGSFINNERILKNDAFTFRNTTIFTVSEPLELYTETECTDVIHPNSTGIKLDHTVNNLQAGQQFVISSTAQEIKETVQITDIMRDSETGITILMLAAPLRYRYELNTLSLYSIDTLSPIPVLITDTTTYKQLSFISSTPLFTPGTNLNPPLQLILKGQAKIQSETFTINDAEDIDGTTILYPDRDLENIYNPAACIIYGNVVSATHGDTVTEVLGHGDSKKANQRFILKQLPLTYVSSANAKGIKSTLEIRINDIRWDEVDDLLQLGPDDRAYVVQQKVNGQVIVIFGDGVHGARLPSGQENVVAIYRIGLGLQGHLPTNSISLLQTQPLGVEEALNPIPASGAAEPETVPMAQKSATLHVIALDRIISLRDYEFFVQGFAGIAKSQVDVLRTDQGNIVYITLVGAGGTAISETSALYQNLLKAIKKASDARHFLKMASYKALSFNVSAKLKIDPHYSPEQVISQAKQQLSASFSIDNCELAQAVSVSDILDTLQEIEGVLAVDVDYLYYSTSSKALNGKLSAQAAKYELSAGVSTFTPAELLTINPSGIELTEMAVF